MRKDDDKPLTDRWLSVREIALYLGVSRDSVYKLISSKNLPAYKVGRFWKFKKIDVDQWVKKSHQSDLLQRN